MVTFSVEASANESGDYTVGYLKSDSNHINYFDDFSEAVPIVIGKNERKYQGHISDFGGVSYQYANEDRPVQLQVIGMSRNTALSMSGVTIEGQLDNDDPCSSRHNVGDVSNRWCHAYFSELAHSVLKENGYNEYVAHAGGLLVLLLKELGDINYDWSDVNTAPIGGQINETTATYVTLMMDGSFHFHLSKKFQL